MLILHSYVQCAQTWVNTSEGMRICWKVAALNAGVWITWQVPRLQPFMKRAFMHHPLSSRYYTMLTSVFSHSNFLHGLFNMMALSSFGGATVLWMEKSQGTANSRLQESTAQYHFLAFFATAGIFSSLVSHIVSTRFRFPRALKAFSAPGTPSSSSSTLGSKMTGAGAGLSQQAAASAIKSKHNILPSLGASGAVYSTLAITALAFPETHVSLIFPPTGSIPIEYGFAGLVLIDTVGILRGWRLFDHWAHLGGAAFGAFYWMYGPTIWDANRVQAAALRLSLFGKAPPMDDVD
ncbi:hypothetical protein SISSUDRAFT_1069068 [Sistotremastrum suecicum HHB10207 ss-3]|uniref:Peptidase S54 rhomboid domain-containing protein n=1 Tax=Sistotremastrum suecicum HHB10207 ss-3 TaxID=1314776 RepID=A0A166HZI4_9AGAM|nr:hypothetical protein SISSUDRAFT_1069068 [Sistotremastrum suecicum HHB10207 ss-3]